MNLEYMTGEEFIKQLSEGRRYFPGIKLEEGFDLTGHSGFKEFCEMMREIAIPGTMIFKESENPLVLDYSDLSYVKANKLWVPFLEAKRVNFEGAELVEAHFLCTELNGANFNKADLQQGLLHSAKLKGASFFGADLKNAYLAEADLDRAVLREAQLKNACFYKAWLAGVDFTDAEFYETDFVDAGIFFNCRAEVKGLTEEEMVLPRIITDPDHPKIKYRKEIEEGIECVFREIQGLSRGSPDSGLEGDIGSTLPN